MAWALIRDADNAWLGGPLETEPSAGEGERVVVIPLGWPDTCEWSPTRGGFVDLVTAAETMTVGRFKLLFTQAERIALREAAKTQPMVDDFLDLLSGFTDGVSIADPVLVGSIEALVPAGLLTSERAAAILAGAAPDN